MPLPLSVTVMKTVSPRRPPSTRMMPACVRFRDGLLRVVEQVEQHLLHLLRGHEHGIGNLARLGDELDIVHSEAGSASG